MTITPVDPSIPIQAVTIMMFTSARDICDSNITIMDSATGWGDTVHAVAFVAINLFENNQRGQWSETQTYQIPASGS